MSLSTRVRMLCKPGQRPASPAFPAGCVRLEGPHPRRWRQQRAAAGLSAATAAPVLAAMHRTQSCALLLWPAPLYPRFSAPSGPNFHLSLHAKRGWCRNSVPLAAEMRCGHGRHGGAGQGQAWSGAERHVSRSLLHHATHHTTVRRAGCGVRQLVGAEEATEVCACAVALHLRQQDSGACMRGSRGTAACRSCLQPGPAAGRRRPVPAPPAPVQDLLPPLPPVPFRSLCLSSRHAATMQDRRQRQDEEEHAWQRCGGRQGIPARAGSVPPAPPPSPRRSMPPATIISCCSYDRLVGVVATLAWCSFMRKYVRGFSLSHNAQWMGMIAAGAPQAGAASAGRGGGRWRRGARCWQPHTGMVQCLAHAYAE